MGRRTQDKKAEEPLEYGNQGCSFGILPMIKYHHWRHVKKRMVLKKRANYGLASGEKDDASSSSTIMEQNDAETRNAIVDEKDKQSVSSTKSSLKSRLKARIAEEISRKKGRHSRTTSCPVRPHIPHSDSVRSKPSDADPNAQVELSDGSLGAFPEELKQKLHASSLDPVPAVTCEKPSTSRLKHEEAGTMLIDDSSDNNPVEQNQATNNSISQQDQKEYKFRRRSMNASIISADAPPHHIKDFMDALDIINEDKDFLLNVMQDENSPLAQYFQNQQAISAKGFNNSMSFSSLCSSVDEDTESTTLNMESDKMEEKGEGKLQIGQRMSFNDLYKRSVSSISGNKGDAFPHSYQAGNTSSTISTPNANQKAVMRFKDLRQKIKHVIKEGRKERHRIAMDAVLHKIPHGQEFNAQTQWKDPLITRDGKDSPARVGGSEVACFSSDKPSLRHMRRSSSHNELLDRYCQLYKTTNREETHPGSERLNLRSGKTTPPSAIKKSFDRNQSLPGLNFQFYRGDELSHSTTPGKHNKTTDDAIEDTNDEKQNLDIPKASEGPLHSENSMDTELEEEPVSDEEVGSELDVTIELDLDEGLPEDTFSLNDQFSQSEIHSTPGDAEACSLPLSESNFLKDTVSNEKVSRPEDSESEMKPSSGLDFSEPNDITMDIATAAESDDDLSKYFHHGIHQLQVKAKGQAEFNYVRDVLNLSGFSGNVSLGTMWHSNEHDPSVYEEMEGCLLLDPDCSGNKADGHCKHLLLFDLINEVLLEIYGQSYSYHPMPLSCLCHIRPMPAGSNVLRKVWTHISWYLKAPSENDQSLDYFVSRDLAKGDGWLNLQFDTECVGLELEDMIFHDLCLEIMSD